MDRTALITAMTAFGFGWALKSLAVEYRKKYEKDHMCKLAKEQAERGGTYGEARVAVRPTLANPDIVRQFGLSASDTALVLIDMQTDFLSPKGRLGSKYDSSKLETLKATTASVGRLLTAARKAGLTIAHSRSHRYGATVRVDLARSQPLDEGYELVPELRALPGEIVVDKWTFGAFASTDLEQELRKRGVKRILLGGILTNVCVMATAVQACDRLFRVCLVEEACGAFNPEWHEKAVALMNEPQISGGHADGAVGLYFAEVANLNEVENALATLK